MTFLLNQFNFYSYVIPALSRNPESETWIPAFAGMTKCEIYFLETALGVILWILLLIEAYRIFVDFQALCLFK